MGGLRSGRIGLPEIQNFKGGRVYDGSGSSLLGVTYGSERLHPLERDSLGGWGLHYRGELDMTFSGLAQNSNDITATATSIDSSMDLSYFFEGVLRGFGISLERMRMAKPDWYTISDSNGTLLREGYLSWSGSNGSYTARVELDEDIYPSSWVLGSTVGTSKMKRAWADGDFLVTGGSMDKFVWTINMSG